MKTKKLLCSALSVVLALGMSPTTALANTTSGNTASGDGDTAPAAQIKGTPGVDYAEGEVLVAVRGGVSALEAETSTSTLAQVFGSPANKTGSSTFTVGESLTTVSIDDIAAAAGNVGTTDEVNLGAGAGGASLASTDADDVEIIALKCDDVAQTIADLRNLDCVVVAQPNYSYQLIDGEESCEEAAGAVASAIQGGSSTATANESAVSSTSVTEPDETAALVNAASGETATLADDSATLASATDGTSEPFYPTQWSLQSEESLEANGYSGTTGMDVEGAWAEGAGNEEGGDVVVAVVDSGVDYTHEDLAANMWAGGEAEWSTALGGGKYGLNPSADGETGDPMDAKNGHGTHVASTIAAAWNGTGIAGVNNKVDIMAIRMFPGGTLEAICGYNYLITAKENGVNVVAANNSWGSTYNMDYSDTLMEAMLYKAGTEGIISVFAAGNVGCDNDLVAGWHRNNSNPYVLTVGALNSSSEGVNFSDYGELSVDVFSPGTEVLAATTSYGAKTGASVGMDGNYLPWLKDSASAKSTYFLDEAQDVTNPDGITYDLVTIDEYYNLTSVGEAEIFDKGYANAGVNNGRSLRFNLKDAGNAVEDGQYLAIRVMIPAVTWESYKSRNKGDDLYFAAIGALNGQGFDDPYLKLCAITDGEWGKLNGAINFYHKNWYALSSHTSLSKIDEGKGADGDVTILLRFYNLNKTTFTEDDYIYLDNISLGWAANSDSGTAGANDTYCYSDGTSMAAPNTTGALSLLCSHAAAESDDGYLQSADTAREIVSFVKGGVTRLPSLSDLCSAGGATDAAMSYSAYTGYLEADTESDKLTATAKLKPVPDAITDNGNGTCTLEGSFFGAVEGTVTFGDTKLEVTEWTESTITFKSLSCFKEQADKVVVTKANKDEEDNDITGQSYLILPAGASSAKTFDTLPNPDFNISLTFTTEGGQTYAYEANAGEAAPVCMTAADGFVYVFGTYVADMSALLRYDTTTGTWDEKNCFGEYSSQVFGWDVQQYVSMAAGRSEIYIKYQNRTTKKNNLMTLDAKTGNVKYNVEIGSETNSTGSLGFLDGKLYLVGGEEGEPVCTAIYPNTGAAYWSSEATLPTNAVAGVVTSNGSGFEITGSFNSTDAVDGGYTAGVRNKEISVTLSDEDEVACTVSGKVFFPLADEGSDYGLDEGQTFATLGAAAADGAVIVTGPVRYNKADNMIDTWYYQASTDKWTPIRSARFAPAAVSAVCSCTYGGTYYVMAADMQQEGVTQRFGSFPISEWGLTDEKVTPDADALCDVVLVDSDVYRLYNAATSEHLWTTDANEYEELTRCGWIQEGTAWQSPTEGTAVYRLYNPSLGTHHYTSDAFEVAELVAKWGWVPDNGGKAIFYSADGDAEGSIAVYRMYNDGLGQHLLTMDGNEYATLPAHGWRGEGVAFRAYPA